MVQGELHEEWLERGQQLRVLYAQLHCHQHGHVEEVTPLLAVSWEGGRGGREGGRGGGGGGGGGALNRTGSAHGQYFDKESVHPSNAHLSLLLLQVCR